MGKTNREILKSLKQLGNQINLDPAKDEEMHDWLLNCYQDTFPKKNTFNFNFYLNTLRPVAISLLVFVFVFVSGIGLVYGSKNTLPGSLLYSVKLKIEKTRIALAPNQAKKAVLRAQTLSNRLGEAKILASKAKQGEQTFAPEFLFLADNFQKELEVLKNEVASQILKNKPEDKENSVNDKYFFVPMQPDLPIQDGKKVAALDIEKLLLETKELLTENNLITALVKIEQAEKLVMPDIEPVIEEEVDEIDTKIEEPIIEKQENISTEKKSEQVEKKIKKLQIINYKPIIQKQAGSVGRVLEQVESNDFKVDMKKDSMVRTIIKRDLNNK